MLATYFVGSPERGNVASMRVESCLALALLTLASCTGPLAAVPLATALAKPLVKPPQALAAPTEDGAVYVLAESGRMGSETTLRSMWRRKATQVCDGDYMVMSELYSQSRQAGLLSGQRYEGFVRCVSPEGMKPE